jgi:hypothetical protein
MNQGYASQIAREWNAPSAPDFIGFVLRFKIPSSFVAKYPIQTVGGKQHQELWVPAEELEHFNRQIIEQIEVIEVHQGTACIVEINEETKMPKAWSLMDVRAGSSENSREETPK